MLFVLCLWALPVRAQVAVEVGTTGTVVKNEGYAPLQLEVNLVANNLRWVVYDNVGNTYELAGYEGDTSGGRDGGGSGETVIIGGYQGGEMEEGYDYFLDVLREAGAVISHDEVLDVDVVTFPNLSPEEDAVRLFFSLLLGKMYDGKPLQRYLRFLEFASLGVLGPASPAAAQPSHQAFMFPDDAFYPDQWNLDKTRLAEAQWHPARTDRAVRIGLIDSGVGAAQQAHGGLDGTPIQHVQVAPTQQPAAHALGILTLMTDRGNDGDGIVSLLGDAWQGAHCYEDEPLLARRPAQVVSYNVGDDRPNSLYVARAIRASIADGVDVLNLSFSMGYSPVVEQAVRDALAEGIIVVAAAGNYSVSAESKRAKWPANMDGVIAVGAADTKLRLSLFSADTGVDILAPGEDLVLGGPDNRWVNGWGTSFAAPHVAAAVAMMRAVTPDLSPAAALEALQARSQQVKDGVGFLNAFSAVNHVLPAEERVRKVAPLQHCSATAAAGKADLAAALSWSEAGYDHSLDADLFGPLTGLPGAGQQSGRVALLGNSPNPFAAETILRFYLPEPQSARLAVYNMLGQEVEVLADGRYASGIHDVRFDARNLPSGIYVSRLETASGAVAQTMMLVR